MPRVAIRRYTDRCFFEVEEIVPGGYIVEGFMIDQDDVAEVISLGVDGVPLPPCTLADTDEMTGPPGLDSE